MPSFSSELRKRPPDRQPQNRQAARRESIFPEFETGFYRSAPGRRALFLQNKPGDIQRDLLQSKQGKGQGSSPEQGQWKPLGGPLPLLGALERDERATTTWLREKKGKSRAHSPGALQHAQLIRACSLLPPAKPHQHPRPRASAAHPASIFPSWSASILLHLSVPLRRAAPLPGPPGSSPRRTSR